MSRSDHRFARQRLDAFVDDELVADDVDWVAGHLIECPDCSAHVRFLLRLRASLLGLRVPADHGWSATSSTTDL